MTAKKVLNVVVEGCCHGELNSIYAAIERMKKPVDLVIIGGDFQAIRNEQDLNCIAMPRKYRQMGDFHEYYTGKRKAPYPTVVIGGNHEASSYMWELFYGGWLAPNIYYLGAASVVNFRGLRIAGMSGIWNPGHYHWNHFERLPYNSSTERSAYHIRQFDVLKLSLLQQTVDVMLSHDWPAGIEKHGDLKWLLKVKKHFIQDVERGELGSVPAMALLKTIKPKYWFSAHLHVRYQAVVQHSESFNSDEIVLDLAEDEPKVSIDSAVNEDAIDLDITDDVTNADEIVLDDIDVPSVDADAKSSDTKPIANSPSRQQKPPVTAFLALDKCLPKRRFLEHVKIPVEDSHDDFQYDPEWLAVTRAMHPYFVTDRSATELSPDNLPNIKQAVAKEQHWVDQNIVSAGKLQIPNNFLQLTPTIDDIAASEKNSWVRSQPPQIHNNQTDDFCRLLNIDNRIC